MESSIRELNDILNDRPEAGMTSAARGRDHVEKRACFKQLEQL